MIELSVTALVFIIAVFIVAGFVMGWAVGSIFGYNEGVQQVARDQHINLCSTSEVPRTCDCMGAYHMPSCTMIDDPDSSLVTRHSSLSPEVNS